MTFTKQTFLLVFVLQSVACTTISSPPKLVDPSSQYADLFEQVQMSGVYPDSKTFVDANAKRSPEAVMALFQEKKGDPNFDIHDFVSENFELPSEISSNFDSDISKGLENHINRLWPVLSRSPSEENEGSLIALPQEYIVPGGRFREIYYWDSFFTMLGLMHSDQSDLIEKMIKNFSFLVDQFGFIPNGNRTYYLSRSQPPFYSLMVYLLDQQAPDKSLAYVHYVEKEYQFWMRGSDKLSNEQRAIRRVVRMDDGSILNRYWDEKDTPRPESHKEDVELIEHTGGESEGRYRDVRAAAESGWDFSSRWFADRSSMETINTIDIVPVDLNSLLYFQELFLAELYRRVGNDTKYSSYHLKSQNRKNAIHKYLWNQKASFYTDYNYKTHLQSDMLSLAGVYPLLFNIATNDQAARVSSAVKDKFLFDGGVVTTLNNTGQQWDYPNGWAPLQWITIVGLANYGEIELSSKITDRWVALNKKIFEESGKLVEKYNVVDTGLKGGGGEYPLQDGFGWTNGVLLWLLKVPSHQYDNFFEHVLFNKVVDG